MLHILEPYRQDKNLGRAYNDAIRYYEEEDWICLKDYDTLFLLPDTIRQIDQYTHLYPGAGILTCYTNRIANSEQLTGLSCIENDSIRNHIKRAKSQEMELFNVTELTKPISGFLMVIKKKTWHSVKFDEGCLGVDNQYHKKIVAAGLKVLRMNGIYVWHTYRLIGGIKDKTHLTLDGETKLQR